jgi:hypothetical protein
MATTVRLLPPVNASTQIMSVNGRNYASTPGHGVDVPDTDAGQLCANGWMKVAFSGPTTGRPGVSHGFGPYFTAAPATHFWDTTLSKLVVFDGATWRDPNNGNAV